MKNWKDSLDQGGHYDALLSDLSKAFDCTMLRLLRRKLESHGFDSGSLNVTCNYLLGREQRIKTSSSFSI